MLRFPERLAVLCLLAVAAPAAAENLLANPHFDGSLAGWTAAPGAAWSTADVAGSAGSFWPLSATAPEPPSARMATLRAFQ